MPQLSLRYKPPTFFDQTVRDLDVHFVASHGRLLLGRNSKTFLVCSTEEDRWISIPLPVIPVNVNTVAGLRHEADPASGLNFTVPLPKTSRSRRMATGLRYEADPVFGLIFTLLVVVPVGGEGVAVKSFSSTEGVWRMAVLQHEAAATLLGKHGVGPGIYASDAFFWKSADSKSGTVLKYNPLDEKLTVIGEPPKETVRFGASLGSSGGCICLFSFEVANEGPYEFRVVGLDDNLSTWEANGTGGWTRIKSMAVGEVCWELVRCRGLLDPLDYDSARDEWLVVRKDEREVFYMSVQSWCSWVGDRS